MTGKPFFRYATLAVAIGLDLVFFRPTGGPADAGD